ncbi:MAG: NAD(+)/NADH kinase [Chloroflexi bacterium]|jgi:NAD+ kinase|nr:NAD(+)/NADH kinase [Chloroflexota bacterium]
MSDEAFIPKNILLMPNAGVPKAMAIAKEIHQHFSKIKVHSDIFAYDFDRKSEQPVLVNSDLVIVIGGDGTLLRAGHLCAVNEVPLLGIQAGTLGFLVEIKDNEWPERMERLMRGEFRIERRMMLNAELIRGDIVNGRWDVINEIVISRGSDVRPIEVRVDLSEGFLASYKADGLIVSTATGSTAYAFSAGGPILPPELRNMLIMPVSPHLSLDRGVVLAEGAKVSLRKQSDNDAILSVDGMKPIYLSNTDRVVVSGNKNSLKMVRFGEPNYFYRDLAAVMRLNPILRINNID